MLGVMAKNTPTDPSAVLRREVVDLLASSSAHASFDDIVAGIPPPLRGSRPPGQSHTPWRLLEHMRIAQRDILEFCRDAAYRSPPWPQGYWPPGDAPPDDGAWDRSVEAFRADLRAVQELVDDETADPLAPLPWAADQTILGEALLVADHNAYHLGQMVDLRRALGCWPPEELSS